MSKSADRLTALQDPFETFPETMVDSVLDSVQCIE